MSRKDMEAKWDQIQKKTFTRWANTYLKERLMKIDDLQTDFQNGVKLINLLEIISSKSLGKFNQKPKMRPHLVENNLKALNFLKQENIKLVNIGAEDICDGRLKLILGLIWTIILRYQIHIEEGKSARSDLLKWVQSKIPDYDIKNFTSNWNDGKAICALGEALLPGQCPDHWDKDPGDAFNNAKTGMDNAEKNMEIPQILHPEDMVNPDVDELSMMTYISYFRDWERNQSDKAALEKIENTAIPELCRAYGPGLEKGEALVKTNFTIEAINKNKRRVPHGQDPFVIQIVAPSGAQLVPEVDDQNDGLYHVSYKPVEPGNYDISITLHEKPIQGNPWTVPISEPVADASFCRAYGPGLEGGQIGQPGQFTVEAYNREGERLPVGGDQFDVTVTAPDNSTVPAKVTDNGDGSYSVEYTPEDIGKHTVNVNLKEQPIKDAPFTVDIDKNPLYADAQNTKAFGPGLEGGNTAEPSVFTIETRNNEGKLVVCDNNPVGVEIKDPNGRLIDCDVKDNGDGTFTATYQPEDAGDFEVGVFVRHPLKPMFFDHIPNSPFKVSVDPGTDASQTIAYGPGVEDNVPTDTLPTYFNIQANDKYGNPIKEGGDNFKVQIIAPDGSEVPATLTDNNDGTYKVDYQPTDAGLHTINVDVDGKPIKNAPFSIHVRHGADAGTTNIKSFSFVIQANTKQGQPKTEGGDDISVRISDSNDQEVTSSVDDNNDGTYTANYSLPAGSKGTFSIAVMVDKKNINGSPFQYTIPS